MARPSKKIRNTLLLALSEDDRGRLVPDLKAMEMPVYTPLEEPAEPIEHVYFMDSGIASVVAVGSGDRKIEIGLVGREGMTGAAVVLGAESSPHETYIQAAGGGHRIRATKLQKGMRESASLTVLLLRYAQVFSVQTAHTAVANARGKLEERLARWLLMAHDRIDGDELPLTHEFIALMLGVRRAGVTEGIESLERENMISGRRGRVTVLDRAALEKRAAGYYGVPEREYRRLIG
jgi:CRP-like cAMP-binding protein